MTSSSPTRRRARLGGAAALACVLLSGGLSTLGTGTASAALLPAPPVIGPSDDGPVLKEVVLDWTGVVGASSYVVQVGTDEEWSDEPTLELTTVASRLTLPTSLPHASYVWRVAAVGKDGQGSWSSGGTFTRGWPARPQLLAPLGGLVDPAAGVPTFRWTPVPTASEYQLQVSTSPYFDGPTRNQADVETESCFTTRTVVTPANGQATPKGDGAGPCRFTLLGTGAPLHWRVRALDRIVGDVPVVDTTPVVDEGISSQPPAKADELDTSACPTAPGGGTSAAPPIGGGAASPSPSPSPSVSPSGSASASPSASPSASGSASPTPSASASPSAGAGKPTGPCEPANAVEKGAWSAPSSFAHVWALPSPAPYFGDLPAASRPAASADSCLNGVCRDFPTVSWAPVPGAQWYRVSVALDAAFANIQSVVETPALTWTPTFQWRDSTAGASYHVVVQACTVEPAADGRRPGCDTPSSPLTFKKSSPRLVPSSPADAAAVGGDEVVLSWQAASSSLAAATGRPATSEAYAYRVQVAPASNPAFVKAGLAVEELVDSTSHVSATVRFADGSYLWRVQAVDASGHRLPWSAVRTFTRDGTPPTFTVGAGGTLAPTGAVPVTFSEPVTGVGTGTISLSGVLATVSVTGDGRRALLAPGRRLLPGAAHTVIVGAGIRDAAGNGVLAQAVPAVVDPVVDDRSPVLALGGAWKRLAATNAVRGTWSRSIPTAGRPATATVSLSGRAAEVRGCVGPANGTAEVRVDGVRVSTVDTYRSYSGCGVVLARTSFPPGTHRVEVRGTGTKSAKSRGTAVAVDAITAVR